MHRFYESKDIADAYFKYRPTYPKELVEQVMHYRDEDETKTKTYDLLIDVGCGSGQACSLFQPYFQTIIGIDVSEEQIKQAMKYNKHQNISYQIGSAEKIPADDKSVDVVIAGIAAHWFDLPKFFKEVERVLKPNGCLALFSYVICDIGLLSRENKQLAQNSAKLLVEVMMKGLPKHDLATAQTSLEVFKRYAGIYEAIPYAKKKRVDNMYSEFECSLATIEGIIKSVHCYENFKKEKIEELKKTKPDFESQDVDDIDLAREFEKRFRSMWNIENAAYDDKLIKITFDYYLLLAKI